MFKWLFKKKGCAKHMNNKLEVIGIDHGWSMMKTISQVFVTGVKEITTTPALFGEVLEYEGKFYKVGTVRQHLLQKDFVKQGRQQPIHSALLLTSRRWIIHRKSRNIPLQRRCWHL